MKACGNKTTGCARSVEPKADAAATKIVLGNVLVPVGAAAIAGGLLWWLLTPRPAKVTKQLTTRGRSRGRRGIIP